MNEIELPPFPASDYPDSVVKWRDRYFKSAKRSWKPVGLISSDEKEDFTGRFAMKMGVGVAGVFGAIIAGVFTLVISSSIALTAWMAGVAIALPIIIATVGVIFLVLAAVEWRRFGGKTSVAESGTLWGVAQKLTGASKFIDLDSSEAGKGPQAGDSERGSA